jgi:hypothetical protein
MALTQEQIDKLRKIYAESTNELAKKGAKEKLEAEGISLTEKKEEKKVEKKEEPKEKKAEAKTEKKPEKKAEKPKREQGEEEEEDCDDLIEREKSAEKSGYDIDELLRQAKERKAKAKKRALEKKSEPKKTPITKAKEKVEKTTKTIVKGLETSAEKGKLTATDLERLIAEYEEALKRLRKMLEKVRAEKMARGGRTKPKPKMVRTIFEEEEFDYARGGGIDVEDYYENLAVYVQGKGQIYQGTSMKKAVEKANLYMSKNPKSEIAIVDEKYGDEYDLNGNLIEEYKRGGRTTMVDARRDKMFRAKPSGKRKSKKIAVVEMKSGGSYRRRNSNQYYNESLGNRSEIGGRTYYESANNRSDKNKWS